MSTTMTVPAGEHGVLRLFAIKLPVPEISAFCTETYDDDDNVHWPLEDALGATYLDHDFIEVFPVTDLGSLKLSGYLSTGNGIPQDQIDPMRAQLDGLSGHVLLVFSAAFSGAAQNLRPKAPLVHIGTFFEETPPVNFEPLPDESAKRTAPEEPAKKPLSDAAIGGRVATVALLVAFGVAAMMVWMAG